MTDLIVKNKQVEKTDDVENDKMEQLKLKSKQELRDIANGLYVDLDETLKKTELINLIIEAEGKK